MGPTVHRLHHRGLNETSTVLTQVMTPPPGLCLYCVVLHLHGGDCACCTVGPMQTLVAERRERPTQAEGSRLNAGSPGCSVKHAICSFPLNFLPLQADGENCSLGPPKARTERTGCHYALGAEGMEHQLTAKRC